MSRFIYYYAERCYAERRGAEREGGRVGGGGGNAFHQGKHVTGEKRRNGEKRREISKICFLLLSSSPSLDC
jgi:hypothetical protein